MSRKIVVYFLSFLALYSVIYFTTGTILFIYESTWIESQGAMWDLSSMNTWQAIAYVVWFVPNFPLGGLFSEGIFHLMVVNLVNPILIGGILLRVFSLYRPHWIIKVSKINFWGVIFTIMGWIIYFLNA
jgi:hypothetical protein